MGAAGSVIGLAQAQMTMGDAWSQSQAMRQQGEHQRQMYNLNSKFSYMQAEDAIKRGDKAADQHLKQTKSLIGSQRTALAAQGIDIGDGSALEIQQDTAELGAMDAMTIRNNAWRESWGHRVQASQLYHQGRWAELGAKNQARNTLITGGISALGQAGSGFARMQAPTSGASTASGGGTPMGGQSYRNYGNYA